MQYYLFQRKAEEPDNTEFMIRDSPPFLGSYKGRTCMQKSIFSLENCFTSSLAQGYLINQTYWQNSFNESSNEFTYSYFLKNVNDLKKHGAHYHIVHKKCFIS